MNFTPLSQIKVGLDFGHGTMPVGRLAIRDRQIFFEYSAEFVDSELQISPFRLPLRSGVQTFDRNLFEGLPGVFNDSLPDGWGRLLVDRTLRSKGLLPEQVSPLDRLALVGTSGLGALIYQPDLAQEKIQRALDLDRLAAQSAKVLEGRADVVLGELLALNGSSAGARPKALIGFDRDHDQIIQSPTSLEPQYEPWIVKFANAQDGPDAGAIEFVYAEMARKAGIEIPQTHLFSATRGAGYFSTKRFDRNGIERLHVQSASGLLHSDFRTPSLDYQDLIELTALLTRDIREVEKMFRLAVFNVMAHNRDDHAKNFSFLMDRFGRWQVSPAYDLTFSSGPSGEQSTMVMGEGRAPTTEHLKALGRAGDLRAVMIDTILDQTRAALAEWPTLAQQCGVAKTNIKLIGSRFVQ